MACSACNSRHTRARRSSVDQDENAAGPAIVNPEPGASQHAAADDAADVEMREPTAVIVKPDPIEPCSDSDADADEAMNDEEDAAPAPAANDDTEAAIVKPDPALDDDAAAPASPVAPVAAPAAAVDDDEDDDEPEVIDEEAAALDAAEATGGGGGATELAPMEAVRLPKDAEAQQLYIDRALGGLGHLLVDCKVLCKAVYRKIKPSLECAAAPICDARCRLLLLRGALHASYMRRAPRTLQNNTAKHQPPRRGTHKRARAAGSMPPRQVAPRSTSASRATPSTSRWRCGATSTWSSTSASARSTTPRRRPRSARRCWRPSRRRCTAR